MTIRKTPETEPPERVAGGGLLHRRTLLVGGAMLGGAALARPGMAAEGALEVPDWMTKPGLPMSNYGLPSKFEAEVQRGVLQPYGELAPGTGVSMTPLHLLEGTTTPNGLFFERHHNGVPEIDPSEHRLAIHGLVEQPLMFRMEDLVRYPQTTKTCFIECSGNSFFNAFAEPQQMPAGMIHGLVSQAEWTGVSLAALLDEAGVQTDGSWVLAEGADAAGMSRSIPMEKAMDDVLVALYQNGERLRPEQGYPVRLVLPGFEGNMHVKWLRRLKVVDGPIHTKDETSKYTELTPDGTSRQFTYVMGVKSVILRPSFGFAMQGPGFYEVSGLAWSGAGSIAKVEVSADGGSSWAEASIDGEPRPQALARFRMGWDWDGGPATLMSRATDDAGNTQVARSVWAEAFAPGQIYHMNAIQAWQVGADGEISNAFV